ncbi:MAG: Lrp/AsnC ligand binding domain-containing protein [Candidatus Undinarchaeales archaeon]
MRQMVTAFILITTKAGKEKEVREKLEKLSVIQDVQVVYGDFDIIAKLKAKNMDELNSFIFDKIRTIPEISVTSTLVST